LNVKDHHTQFWDSLRNLLPCLHSLVDLAFTFTDNDGAFLERLVSQADLERTLPPSIKTLHLKRLYTQSIPEVFRPIFFMCLQINSVLGSFQRQRPLDPQSIWLG
jgi:hypothetical protein